jgi:hypothetical protein
MHMRQHILGVYKTSSPMQERAAPASGPRPGVAYTQEGVLPSWAAGRIQLEPRFRAGGPDPGTESPGSLYDSIPAHSRLHTKARPTVIAGSAEPSIFTTSVCTTARLGRPPAPSSPRACARVRDGARRASAQQARAPGRLRAAGGGSQAGSE